MGFRKLLEKFTEGFNAFHRHTIDTSEITPIGNGDSQVIYGSIEGI